jgi:hypothetical protein
MPPSKFVEPCCHGWIFGQIDHQHHTATRQRQLGELYVAIPPAITIEVSIAARVGSRSSVHITQQVPRNASGSTGNDEAVFHEVAAHPYHIGEPQPEWHRKYRDNAAVQAAFPREPGAADREGHSNCRRQSGQLAPPVGATKNHAYSAITGATMTTESIRVSMASAPVVPIPPDTTAEGPFTPDAADSECTGRGHPGTFAIPSKDSSASPS